jgi:tetratricopeptide (TPR) repeat protein
VTPSPTPPPTATPRPTAGPGLGTLLETPQALYLEADIDGAAAAYEGLQELYPQAVEPFLGLATIAQREGDEDAALAFLEDARQIDPDNREVLRRLATLYDKRGEYEALLSVYQSLIALEPTNAELPIAAGRAAARLGDAEATIEALKAAQQQNPLIAFAWTNSAAAAIAEREYQAAVDIATAGLDAHPDAAGLYNQRGLAYLSLLEPSPALADFQAAAENDPFNTTARLWAGRVLYDQGEYEAAFEASDAAAELGVVSGITGAEEGYLAAADAAAALAESDIDAAFSYMAERVFDYGSQNGLLLGYARIDLARGSTDLAINRLNALVLREYTPALYWRAVAHLANGDEAVAVEDLEAFIELTGTGPLAEAARALLAEVE